MHFERALTFSYYSSAFPWGGLGHGASVCDVGGGIGHVTMQLAKAHPTLQLKLQDLPERILQAKNEVWPKECPEAIQENRIEFEPIDFLSESPIKDCNVYYVGSTIFFYAFFISRDTNIPAQEHHVSFISKNFASGSFFFVATTGRMKLASRS